MRGVQPLQHAAVARRLLRRNLVRHGRYSPAGTRTQRKGARALRQRAKPAALPVEHLDLPDMAVGIRIKLYRRRGGIPLVEDGKIIGAVGCSGGTGSQDEATCMAAANTINKTQ